MDLLTRYGIKKAPVPVDKLTERLGVTLVMKNCTG